LDEFCVIKKNIDKKIIVKIVLFYKYMFCSYEKVDIKFIVHDGFLEQTSSGTLKAKRPASF